MLVFAVSMIPGIMYVKASNGDEDTQEFRMALSLGQGVNDNFQQGIKYTSTYGTATTSTQLQQMYMEAGATEMFVRIATKRYDDGDTSVDAYHAALHNLEVGLETCEIAAALDIPINPEIMCAYTYMDGNDQQAPDFKDYPEIEKPDKDWSEYTLEEMCSVLEQYGELVAEEILDTGCTVEYWNIGNEANFGFAGVNVGLDTQVNPNLKNYDVMDMYYMQNTGADFLKENVWNYNGQMMAAVARGIKNVDPDAKFATHIAGLFDSYFCKTYFQTLEDNGMILDQAGMSVYPTSDMATYNPQYMDMVKNSITTIVTECDLPVFIAEYGYPSETLTGAYQNWNTAPAGYDISEESQALYTEAFIDWCKSHGVSGIRLWGLDVLGDWEPMSLFEYDEETRTAVEKPIFYIFDE